MNIAIFGCGYVGLAAAGCFALMGHRVIGVDNDVERILLLQKGDLPFYEPGLKKLLSDMKKTGRLRFSLDSKTSISSSEVVVCATGTPLLKNGTVDMRSVRQVARSFGRYGVNDKIFINKSTLPIGGHLAVMDTIRKAQKKPFNYHFLYKPEFIREGSALEDFMKPDRVVIGMENLVGSVETARRMMKILYASLWEKKIPFLFTDITSAEIIKYASNAFLATKISFINEMAHFSDSAGGNIGDIRRGIGLDKRIGSDFLKAGIGYGGSCLPKDTDSLIEQGKKYGIHFKILEATSAVNKNQPQRFIHLIQERIGSLQNKNIAFWGGAFKPGTDDIRSAPSLAILDFLVKEKARVTLYDPAAIPAIKKIFGRKIRYASTARGAIKNADALLKITAWDEFDAISRQTIVRLMKTNMIIELYPESSN